MYNIGSEINAELPPRVAGLVANSILFSTIKDVREYIFTCTQSKFASAILDTVLEHLRLLHCNTPDSVLNHPK